MAVPGKSILHCLFVSSGLQQALRSRNTLNSFMTTITVSLMALPYTLPWIPPYKMAEWTSTATLGM